MRIRTKKKDKELAYWLERCPSELIPYVVGELLREWGFPTSSQLLIESIHYA